jgi:hypothetical protein
LERQPVLEPKHWYHKLAVKRKDTYRRLALDGLGSSNLISEHAIVRAHDRAQPLLVKIFMSSNYGKRSFNPTETKVRRVFNRDSLDRRYRYRNSNPAVRRQLADPHIFILKVADGKVRTGKDSELNFFCLLSYLTVACNGYD